MRLISTGKKGRVLKFGMIKKFKNGIYLSIIPTWRCNMNCSYCTAKIGTPTMPKDPQRVLDWEEWIKFIDAFPLPIRQINFSGGEPSIYVGITQIIGHVLSKGIYVSVYTNMKNIDKYLVLKPNRKLKFEATFHHEQDNLEHFDNNYYKLSMLHRVDVVEIDKKYLRYSRLINLIKHQNELEPVKNYLRVGPDGLIFTDCFNSFEHYKKERK